MDLATQIAELFATAVSALAQMPNTSALHDVYQRFCTLLTQQYPAVNFQYLADRSASASRRASFAEDLVAHQERAIDRALRLAALRNFEIHSLCSSSYQLLQSHHLSTHASII